MTPPNLSVHAARLRTVVPRLLFAAALIGFCLWQVADHVALLDAGQVLAALGGLAAWQWAAGITAAALSFVAVAGQERAVLAHLGIAADPRVARRAAMASAAISQTVGFGPVVGAIVRRRLMPDLTLRQSAAVSAAITLGFFAGLGLLLLAVWGASRAGAVVLMVLPVAVFAALRLVPPAARRHLPKPLVALRFAFWLLADLALLALACRIMLPEAALAEAPVAFLSVFLLALGAGLASGSPAGTGPFEATLLNALEPADPNGMVAGIIAFRMVAYALPAICGALVALAGPRRAAGRDRPALAPVSAGIAWLRRLPRAEVQLALQGETTLLRTECGALWLAGDLAGTAVMLGDPVAEGPSAPCAQASLSALARHGQRTARVPCLYRSSARLAVAARQRGWRVLPVAREAVIDPLAFSTTGPARAGLRRKLRHAESAGVTVCEPAVLPLAEMACVAAIWALRHGGERGFSMGRFSVETVTRQRVVIARDGGGRLLAFASFHASTGEWVLDLVRAADDLPDGTLYLILCHAIGRARAEGIRRLSLACVPIAGWGLSGIAGRIARRLTARSEGLCQFKSAFRPRWEPRYIAAPGLFGLPLAALAIAHAIHAPRTSAVTRTAWGASAVLDHDVADDGVILQRVG